MDRQKLIEQIERCLEEVENGDWNYSEFGQYCYKTLLPRILANLGMMGDNITRNDIFDGV